MSQASLNDEIVYPESTSGSIGGPMAETDAHLDWTIRIRDMLRCRYAGKRVYVGSQMMVHYEKEVPHCYFVPDQFVVLDCEQRDRDTFNIWEEGRTPNVIIEITSRDTRNEDQVFKPNIYQQLGIGEYFLYDPTADYLNPALRGFRLQDGGYVPIKPNIGGWLACDQLGIELRLDARNLVMRDTVTQQALLTRADAEQEAREAAEAKVTELQSEVQRLRKELKNREL